MNLQDQLNKILQDISAVGVETSLMLGAILLLIVGLASSKEILHKALFVLVLFVGFYFNLGVDESGYFISNSLVFNSQNVAFTSLFLITSAVIVVFPRDGKHSMEFYFMLLSLMVGVSFMMKANSLLLVYISIELTSFVSYLLTSFSFKREGHESAIKYLLFGAMSSAVLLVGLGIIYGATGTLYISEWNASSFDTLFAQVGLLMAIAGIFFKISAVPFHIWVPATYQEAPVDAVASMSILPKLASIVLLKRVLMETGLPISHWIMQLTLLLGIVTVLVGTMGALRQVNARRMISFGAIAHSGFMIPFAVLTGETSSEAFWWYSLVYALMNLGAFYLLGAYEKKEVLENKHYSLTSNEVWIGATFTLVLISLVGIPPLAGFTAKFFLFSLLWESYQLLDDSIFLLYFLVTIFATVVSLFFYLRIPFYTFVSRGTVDGIASIKFSLQTKIIATIFAIIMLLLFFVPNLVVTMHHLINTIHE